MASVARGSVVGLVAAAGAAWGHQWAGGGVSAGPLALVTVLSVLLGVALGLAPGRRLGAGPLGPLLTAAGAQGLWHLLLGPDASAHTHAAHMPSPLAMLAVHALAALAAAAVAAGADRALLTLVRDLLHRPDAPARLVLHAPATVIGPRTLLPRDGRTPATAADRGPPAAAYRPAPLAPAR